MTSYPVPDMAINAILLNRGLDGTVVIDMALMKEPAYKLAQADLYVWLSTAPAMKEQESSVTQKDSEFYLKLANALYMRYGENEDTIPEKRLYGFKGDKFS